MSRLVWSIPIIPVVAIAVWFRYVQTIVPDPYLDEVFHVRQAQKYVQGSWRVWDPKITTPPGLYVASYLHIKAFRVFNPISSNTTNSADFRSINLYGCFGLAWTVYRLLLLIKDTDRHRPSRARIDARLFHPTANTCLFPPLFFFYGLYYTDVLSALAVLFTYQCYLKNANGWVVTFLGIISLLFRQTNIFWVSIFLGGLALCRAIPKGQAGVELPHEPTLADIVNSSWQNKRAYDPLVSEARFEDNVFCIISYAIAAIANLSLAVQVLTPYLVILFAFVAFVIWNGGVVLGDKANHTVSIHLAQMLYFWPYVVFFSLPLLYPILLNGLLPKQLLPSALSSPQITSPRLPRLITTIPILAIMVLIVHYNTLIHPFTLADNRHYIFYIFRILLRHPSIKYLAVPIYFICAWCVIASLGISNTPTVVLSARKREKQPERRSPDEAHRVPDGPRTSFLILWLLSTAASVVTAPLVEPRYFIVPWLIWRIHVADQLGNGPSLSNNSMDDERKDGYVVKKGEDGSHSVDQRLWLETVWFLCINGVIGYVFLYRGFEWPQEPGVVQRFMW